MDPRSSLEDYSLNALKTMLRWRSEPRRDVRTKAEVLTLLRAALYDTESIRGAVATLDPLAREALGLLKVRGGLLPTAALRGQLATWHPDRAASEISAIPAELVRRALAFWHSANPYYYGGQMHDFQKPASGNANSSMLYTPPEILEWVDLLPEVDLPALTPVGTLGDTGHVSQWQQRILAFLRGLEARPSRILQSGAISARDREALTRLLELPDPGGASLDGHLLDFLRTTLQAAGLLFVNDERLLRATGDVSHYIQLSSVQQARSLLNAWLSHGESELGLLNHLRVDTRTIASRGQTAVPRVQQARQTLLDVLRRTASPGHWFELGELSWMVRRTNVEFLVSWLDSSPYQWYLPYGAEQHAYPAYSGLSLDDARGRGSWLRMGQDWDLVEGAFIRVVIEGPLSWLGLAEHTSLNGRDVFAITPLGAQVLEIGGANPAELDLVTIQSDALIVQPNFEIVVYEPEERAELLYQIDRFAERLSVDRLAIYRVTNETFWAGLQLGLAGEAVIALLEAASRTPLPQNVVYTLRDWSRQFERVRCLHNCWLLEAPDEQTLDLWLREPSFADAQAQRVAPTFALILEHRSPELAETLARQGVGVRLVDARDPFTPCAHLENDAILRLDDADANLFVRVALAAVSDPLPAELPVRLQLSRPSIERARRFGHGIEEIQDLLDHTIASGMPPELRFKIKGWSGAYGRFTLGMVGILVAPDPQSFRELRGDRRLTERFLANISPTAALVRLDALDALRASLEARGILVEPYEPGPASVSTSHPVDVESPGLDPSAVYRTTAQVEQFLRQAISQGTLVRIRSRRDGGGGTSTIVVEPRDLRQRGGTTILRAMRFPYGQPEEFKLANIVAVESAGGGE